MLKNGGVVLIHCSEHAMCICVLILLLYCLLGLWWLWPSVQPDLWWLEKSFSPHIWLLSPHLLQLSSH